MLDSQWKDRLKYYQTWGEKTSPQPKEFWDDCADEAVDDEELPLAGGRKLERLLLRHVKNDQALKEISLGSLSLTLY